MKPQEVMEWFEKTGALLKGHFLLRSGLHSDSYFQAALVLQHPRLAAALCAPLAQNFRPADVDLLVSPAMGGILVGHEIGRALGVRAIFAEKNEQSGLELRRGFRIEKGERVLVAEDVVTRGGRVQQTIDLVRSHGGCVVGVAVLVDRSGGDVDFGVPFKSLVQMDLATYQPEACPLCRQRIPLVKPGSK